MTSDPEQYTNVAHIASGEVVQWRGTPSRGLLFRRYDLVLVPFSLVWFGFVVFGDVRAIGGHAPGISLLWSGAFNLVGLYLVAGRFVVDAIVRAHTTYVLTDCAGYIVLPDFAGGARRFGPQVLAGAQLISGRDGFGTIRFFPSYYVFGSDDTRIRRSNASFERIAQAAQVYERVRAIGAAQRTVS